MIALADLRTLEITAERRHREAPPTACGMCGATIAVEHRHIADLDERGIHCACHACAVLFVRDGRGSGRFRTIPTRIVSDANFAMTAARWRALGAPVELAFCFYSSALARPIVCHPGPTGFADRELCPEAWDALVAAGSLALQAQPDVEAVLVHGDPGATRLVCYLIPIDTAYGFAGRLRACWRGSDGGDDARQETTALLAHLRRESRPLAPQTVRRPDETAL